jgi:hypothetical protein
MSMSKKERNSRQQRLSRVVIEVIHCANAWAHENSIPGKEVARVLLAWSCEIARWELYSKNKKHSLGKAARRISEKFGLDDELETSDEISDEEIATFMASYWSKFCPPET